MLCFHRIVESKTNPAWVKPCFTISQTHAVCSEVIIDRFSSKSNLNFSSTLGLAVLLSLCLVSLPCFTCAHYKIRLLHPTGFSVTLALKLSKRKQHVGFRTINPAARLCFAFRFRLPRCLILLNLELVDCEEFLMKICTICVLRHVFVFSPCFITYFSEYSNKPSYFSTKKTLNAWFFVMTSISKGLQSNYSQSGLETVQ